MHSPRLVPCDSYTILKIANFTHNSQRSSWYTYNGLLLLVSNVDLHITAVNANLVNKFFADAFKVTTCVKMDSVQFKYSAEAAVNSVYVDNQMVKAPSKFIQLRCIVNYDR